MQPHTYDILAREEERHWWFQGRRRILTPVVAAVAARHDGPLRILDVGCGTGGNAEMLSSFGAVAGVDMSETAVAYCRARGLVRVQRARAEQLPFADESFDLVTALDVVEHLDDDHAGLREMHRVLRRGGALLVFAPAFMWLWGVQDDVSQHRIRYTRPQLVERLRRAGYDVERATYANLTFFAPILAGRTLMRLTGVTPSSENNIGVPWLNGVFGRLLGAERFWLAHVDLPLGVSVLCLARKV